MDRIKRTSQAVPAQTRYLACSPVRAVRAAGASGGSIMSAVTGGACV
ncbi:MAG: hypothetical protein AB8B85_05640 [Paracoccaceae bacterium]